MFKIKELSSLTGLTIRTLQYYDEIGLVVPKRGQNGHRLYTYADLVTINEIILLKTAGLKLDDIMKQIHIKDNESLKNSLVRQKKILNNQLGAIKNQLLQIENLIDSYERNLSIEDESVRKVFLENNPFKDKVDSIWNLDFNDSQALSHLKNFNGHINFDYYFNKLSKLQECNTSDDCVQNVISEFVSLLLDNYEASFNLNSISELALLYKNNLQAKKHLIQYGEDFNSFLSDALMYFVVHGKVPC